MKQYRKFPTLTVISAGLASGLFVAVPSSGGREVIGGAKDGLTIVGFASVDGKPVTVLQTNTSAIDTGIVTGLRPIAEQLKEVAIDASKFTKEELIGLATASGVEVAKSWTKVKIVRTINTVMGWTSIAA